MLRVVAPADVEPESIKTLLRDYPYRAFQQRRQNIDRDRLADMLWDQLKGGLNDASKDHVVAIEGSKTVGAAGLIPDSWHSEIFGLKMGKIQPLLIYPAPRQAGPPLLEAILAHARHRNYAHLSCRVDASDWAAIQLLEGAGFHLVDGSQKLTRRLIGNRFETLPSPEGIEMGPMRDGDIEGLATIATDTHDTNHFFNDPSLGAENARRLFAEWVRRCCRGLARHVFVVRHRDEPVAFVTYLGADSLKKHLALNLIVLDFIVTHRSWQGKGIAPWLLSESLNALDGRYDWVELRTSFNNYPALSLYHRLGFDTIASDVILHKKFDDEGTDTRIALA
jgi:ribosomal protein S18 acetylase RimI-like enzyme